MSIETLAGIRSVNEAAQQLINACSIITRDKDHQRAPARRPTRRKARN